ncbi:site-2 protease family protein [Altererythrobacter sp. BO-6]|uniref:site-2 protease family protein n=1 Tax=Altererythrobacter sp. BO-6 TaxID=2604537 RepID=UPI0013E18FDF|nr:site-2 protease family protein [Altererythrobacter sp. BO-6]QIG53454.1 site-2 protease family protein [Altererythrobacter sp. BO-6]
MTEALTLALLLIPALVIAIVFHEVAHGYSALLLGDTTARDQRRLTLNPIRHVDPVGTLLVPGMLAMAGAPVFGWAKPVPVRQDRLDNPRYGMMAVAAAGPATNFMLAALGAIALGLTIPDGAQLLAGDGGMPMLAGPDGVNHYLSTGLFFFILINVFLGVFNLLPIPPFDGSHIVEGLLPPTLAQGYRKLRPYGMLLFFALVAATWFAPQWGLLENTIGPPVEWALDKYLGLASAVAG